MYTRAGYPKLGNVRYDISSSDYSFEVIDQDTFSEKEEKEKEEEWTMEKRRVRR